jgi:hypothetical protein
MPARKPSLKSIFKQGIDWRIYHSAYQFQRAVQVQTRSVLLDVMLARVISFKQFKPLIICIIESSVDTRFHCVFVDIFLDENHRLSVSNILDDLM